MAEESSANFEIAPLPTAPPAYAELHCISNFTFLKGASSPAELVEQAYELGYKSLAITDECSLCGVVRAHVAANQIGMKLIIGSEFVLRREEASMEVDCHIVLLATSRQGYGELSHLITRARWDTPKGEYWLDRSMVEANLPEECLLLWIPDLSQTTEQLSSQANWLGSLFPEKLWIAAELLLRGNDRRKLQQLQILGKTHQIPLCAAGGVYMHSPDRRAVQDTLTAIRLNKPIDELGLHIEPNGQRHLRHRELLAKLYPAELLQVTLEISNRCQFSLDELRYEYPAEIVPPEHSPSSYLRQLTEEGINRRWPAGITKRNRDTVERELELVQELKYEHFFLTVYDVVSYAKSKNIYCQGRGSAANSVVCYCLGITEANPDETQLLFERFISKERGEPPDIDVDFENARRDEVISYIYRKYGRHRTAIAATVSCYRSKSAIRDVGKALKMDADLIDHLAKSVFWWGSDLKEQLSDADVDLEDPKIEQLLDLSFSIQDFPRHLSQHVGGFVISRGLLSHLVPTENAAMPDRTVIQWDKDDLESLGLLKVDVLALGMLTALHKAMDLVNSYSERQFTMQTIPRKDQKVYKMMRKADTVGVFQIESRAQMTMLPRLRPRNYYDLVIQIAIVRPGPIEGGMVHPYLKRRNGEQAVEYENRDMEGVLERTLGVPIFQEQVMQIAIVGAGFKPGEADELRRAMAAWKKKGGLEPFKEKFIGGLLNKGYSEDFANRIYKQVKGFGEYGFPESHSASFAHTAYISSWFKRHHPAAFCCALLNSQPMGFYPPAQLIQDAKRHRVEVLAADVNFSDWDCTLEHENPGRHRGPFFPRLRIGLGRLKDLSESGAKAVVESRQSGVFQTVQELVFRSGINKRDLEALAAADALKGLSGDRHRSFWQASGVETVEPRCQQISFYSKFSNDEEFGVDVMLPKPTESQDIFADYDSVGFTLRRHPLSLFRDHLNEYGVTPAKQLSTIDNNCVIKATGIVTARQRPQTASGVTFITIEDETGFINVVVWPKLGEEYRRVVRLAKLMGIVGHVQNSEGVIHLVASNLIDLSSWLGSMRFSSRDFT